MEAPEPPRPDRLDRRPRRRWRRRASAWDPDVSNGTSFELDRRYVEEGSTRARRGWGRSYSMLHVIVSYGAGALVLLWFGFTTLPLPLFLGGLGFGAALFLWWLRAYRAERPWHRRRLPSRPYDPDADAPDAPR